MFFKCHEELYSYSSSTNHDDKKISKKKELILHLSEKLAFGLFTILKEDSKTNSSKRKHSVDSIPVVQKFDKSTS